MKEIKVQVPEGYEIDKENSTFECIKLKPIKFTYEDIAERLFKTNKTYITDSSGTVIDIYRNPTFVNNCVSEKQAQRIVAINKLMNVAKYLNDNWRPNWDFYQDKPCEPKYYISFNTVNNSIDIRKALFMYSEIVHFKSEALAKQAIEILGEETIKLALCTDY